MGVNDLRNLVLPQLRDSQTWVYFVESFLSVMESGGFFQNKFPLTSAGEVASDSGVENYHPRLEEILVLLKDQGLTSPVFGPEFLFNKSNSSPYLLRRLLNFLGIPAKIRYIYTDSTYNYVEVIEATYELSSVISLYETDIPQLYRYESKIPLAPLTDFIISTSEVKILSLNGDLIRLESEVPPGDYNVLRTTSLVPKHEGVLQSTFDLVIHPGEQERVVERILERVTPARCKSRSIAIDLVALGHAIFAESLLIYDTAPYIMLEDTEGSPVTLENPLVIQIYKGASSTLIHKFRNGYKLLIGVLSGQPDYGLEFSVESQTSDYYEHTLVSDKENVTGDVVNILAQASLYSEDNVLKSTKQFLIQISNVTVNSELLETSDTLSGVNETLSI